MFALLLTSSLAHAALTLYDDGTILTAASAGGSFTGGVNAPTVEWDGPHRKFVMYFESPQSSGSIPSDCATGYVIGRATSNDGINFTVDASPVLGLDATAGSNRHCGVSQPAVVFDGTTWHLFFSQSKEKISTAAAANQNTGIGYATSTDGVNFTVLDDPAVPASTDLAAPVGLASAVISGGIIYVLYDQFPDIYLPESPVDRSTPWAMNGMVLDNAAQTWSTTWLFGPSLACSRAGNIELFIGGDDTSGTRSVAYATSPNAYDWTFSAHSPLSGGTLSFSGLNHWDMLHTPDRRSFVFYYSKTDSTTGLKAIGLARTRPANMKVSSRYCPA